MSIPHVLTLLTVLPVCGGCNSSFLGQARTAGCSGGDFGLSFAHCLRLDASAGRRGMGMVESAAWAPSIGLSTIWASMVWAR